MRDHVRKCDIVELKSMAAPPEHVKTTMSAVYILLMDKLPTWKECQKMMADMAFLQKLADFDTSKVTPSMKEKLKVIIEQPDFNNDNTRNCTKALTGIYDWVMDIYSSC